LNKPAGSALLCGLLALALAGGAGARTPERSKQKSDAEARRAGIQQKLQALKRDIARTDIAFDHQQIGMTTVQVVSRLQQGTPAIYCRGYKANEGHIEIDVRSVTVPQLDQIHSAIANLVQENR